MTFLSLICIISIILIPLFIMKFIAIGKDVQYVGESLDSVVWNVKGGNSIWTNNTEAMLIIPQTRKDSSVYLRMNGKTRQLSWVEGFYIRYKATKALDYKRKKKFI